MIGHAFRVSALCYADYFRRSLQLFLLDDLEVTDDVHGCLRGYERELAKLLVFEEPVGYLDDALPALRLAGEVDSDCDLALYVLESEEVKCLIYIFRRDVVQYGTVLQCAYY